MESVNIYRILSFKLSTCKWHANFRGNLKISEQNNWERTEQKINFKRGPKILGGRPMNANDVVVVVLKNILLC